MKHYFTRIVLAGILYLICEIYVADCILYGETQNIFIANLRKVFELRKLKVALKPKKCKLGIFETEYVGRVININGVMINETITKDLNFPLPIWFKQFQSFNG